MSIITRFGALGALSILAACGTETVVVSASGDPVDVSEVFAAAETFTPSYAEEDKTIGEALESDDGYQAIIGLEDGTLVPLKIQVDREANILSVTLGDGDPIVFENTAEDGSSRNWYSEVAGYVYLDEYYDSGYFSGGGFDWRYLSLVTPQENLPESGEVGYTGYFEMEGAESGADGSLALAVDFGSGAVTGGILGALYEGYSCCEIRISEEFEEGPISEGPSGDAFFGTVSGSVEGSMLAATAELTGGTVGGSLDMLGVFTEEGSSIYGGIAGTIDGQTMGGDFEAWTGDEYYDD